MSAAVVETAVRVGTCVTARERGWLDVAADARVVISHRDSLTHLRADLVAGKADAVVVSAEQCGCEGLRLLTSVVRDFPGTLFIGLLTTDGGLVHGAHALGLAGVDTVMDVRGAAGWSSLRRTFAGLRSIDPFLRDAIRELSGAQVGGGSVRTAGWARFVGAAFAQQATTAREVAHALGISPSTQSSRFFRAQLPSPKRYIAYARLLHAARLAERPGMSLAAISGLLGASTPQSFGRMLQLYTGETGARFLSHIDGEQMLSKIRAELITPYEATLRVFDPLSETSRRRAEMVV